MILIETCSIELTLGFFISLLLNVLIKQCMEESMKRENDNKIN